MPDNPADWLIKFADYPEGSPNSGRPFGADTPLALRAREGQVPWDVGCRATFLSGGHETYKRIREVFEEAINAANNSGVPFGQDRGHVYIAGWRLNPNRSFPDLQDPPQDTAWSLVSRLMNAGIKVRILVWYPLMGDPTPFRPHMLSHLFLLNLVRAQNDSLRTQYGLRESNIDIGVAYLDMRVGREGLWSNDPNPDELPVTSHHQKFIVVRGLARSVAFCGGLDLAYTRSDSPVFHGDFQSGDQIPAADLYMENRPNENGRPVTVPDPADRQGADLPPEVYGARDQIWHDHHLFLEGPIVATLERIFAYRWEIPHVELAVLAAPGPADTMSVNTETGRVLSSSPRVLIDPLSAAVGSVLDVLPLRDNAGVIEDCAIQAWQTLPVQRMPGARPFFTGEFTAMTGLLRPGQMAQRMILIFDQYFWSMPYARYLRDQILAKDTLHVIVVLPPYSDMGETLGLRDGQHYLRQQAVAALTEGLDPNQSGRVAVYSLWNNLGADATLRQRGIYCHAKSQAFDQALFACGSANINSRSYSADTELTCAVLSRAVVRSYYEKIWPYLFGQPLVGSVNLDSANWATQVFDRFKVAPRNLIEDPPAGGQLPTQPNPTPRTAARPRESIHNLLDPMAFNYRVEDPTRTDDGRYVFPSLQEIVNRVERQSYADYRIKPPV